MAAPAYRLPWNPARSADGVAPGHGHACEAWRAGRSPDERPGPWPGHLASHGLRKPLPVCRVDIADVDAAPFRCAAAVRQGQPAGPVASTRRGRLRRTSCGSGIDALDVALIEGSCLPECLRCLRAVPMRTAGIRRLTWWPGPAALLCADAGEPAGSDGRRRSARSWTAWPCCRKRCLPRWSSVPWRRAWCGRVPGSAARAFARHRAWASGAADAGSWHREPR